MVLPLITSTIVAIVEGSWIVASISLKYFILGLVLREFVEGDSEWRGIGEEILESSELVVAVIIGLGAFLAFSGLSPSPMFKLFSEIVALGYFAFLFWKY